MATAVTTRRAADPVGRAPAGLLRRVRPRTVPVVSRVLYALYWLPSWRLKQFVRWALFKIEGGCVYSITLRRIMQEHFGITVGMYTHGGWIWPFHLDRGTTVGRYCSIAETARTITHNHPLNTRSTSGLFFNSFFGLVPQDRVAAMKLVIGNDVWIGHNAVVLPSRVVGYRFGEATIAALLQERWWDQPLEQLVDDLDRFLVPLEGAAARAERGADPG